MSRPRFIALLLVLGTLAVYLPAVYHGFTLYDDNDYVTDNPAVRGGLTWAGVKWAFASWHASNWHPLTWLSHMLDCQLFGLDAGMHHAVNVLFHAANSVLLFVLLLRWTGKRDDALARQAGSFWPGAFAAALFAWHPLHVESVAWVAERKDVLSTFFALLALLSYTKYAVENCRRSFWFALVFFALGLMAKPMLVTLPFVLLLLDYWPLRRISNLKSQISNPPARPPSTFNFQLSTIFEKWPFFALSAASCIVTFLAQHHGGAVISLNTVPLHYRLENTPLAYAGYLEKMIWPAHLCVFYPLPDKISPLAVAGAIAVLVLISAAVWIWRGRSPYWLVGWLWFLGTLVPVIGLVQVGGAALADRYSYFPSIGIFLAVALGADVMARRFHLPRIILPAVAGLALAACLVLTHKQLDFWRDDVTLFSHAIDVTKDNGTAHLNLGVALENAGEKDKALAEYRAAVKLDPDRIEAHNDLANLLDDAGHPDEALAEYQAALRLNPNYVPAHNNLGTMLVELGRFDEAMKHYAESARLDPGDWHAPYLMGVALLKQGRDAEAIPHFQQAMQIDPNNPKVLTFLAQVLASDENAAIRNGRAAFAMADKANAITGGVQPVTLDALAMAYAELGSFSDAQQAAQDATNLAGAFGMTNDVIVIGRRLQLYQNHQAFRQSFTNAPLKEPLKN